MRRIEALAAPEGVVGAFGTRLVTLSGLEAQLVDRLVLVGSGRQRNGAGRVSPPVCQKLPDAVSVGFVTRAGNPDCPDGAISDRWTDSLRAVIRRASWLVAGVL